jgi:hypothetical protein
MVPGHNLKTRVEVDHGRGELLQDACVTFHLGGAIRDLRLQRLGAHHRLFEISAIDRERQVRLVGQESPGYS